MKNLIFTSLFVFLSLVLPNQLMAQNTVEKDRVADWEKLTAPPSYPGGLKALDTFLRNTVKYPKQATENNIQGTMQVSFIIEKDGSIGNFRIDRGKGDGLDEEAVRVLKLSKKWNPALIDGKPVRVRYVVPVKFALN